MNTRYEAKIDTIVLRPFYFRGVQYEIGDTFKYNPNPSVGARPDKDFLRNGRIKQLEEDKYSYISLRDGREFFGQIYNYGDIVDVASASEDKRFLFVKRGQLKKVFTDSLSEEIPEIEEPMVEEIIEEEQEIVTEKEPLVFGENLTISSVAKYNEMKAIDLQIMCNEKLNMGKIHFNKKLTQKEFDIIINHLGK